MNDMTPFPPLSPDEARAAYERHLSPRKVAKLRQRELNSGAPWDKLIDINVDMIERHLELVKQRSSSPGSALGRAELIEVRCAIDAAIRRASSRPMQYAAPLYFSESFARCEPGDLRGRTVIEHAIPLTVMVSGARLLQEPERYLKRLPFAITVPICLIMKNEDPEDRTGHPQQDSEGDEAGGVSEVATGITLPFLRYKASGIKVYKVSDFAPVCPETFTWDDHVEEMRKFEAYRPGAEYLSRTRTAGVGRSI